MGDDAGSYSVSYIITGLLALSSAFEPGDEQVEGPHPPR